MPTAAADPPPQDGLANDTSGTPKRLAQPKRESPQRRTRRGEEGEEGGCDSGGDKTRKEADVSLALEVLRKKVVSTFFRTFYLLFISSILFVFSRLLRWHALSSFGSIRRSGGGDIHGKQVCAEGDILGGSLPRHDSSKVSRPSVVPSDVRRCSLHQYAVANGFEQQQS